MSSELPKDGNNMDEIPFARRLRASSRIVYARFRYLLIASSFLTLFTVFVSLNLFSNQELSISTTRGKIKAKISKDGLLLGHFPYEEVSKDKLISIYPGMKVHKSLAKDLEKMRASAASQGIQLIVISGFRSIDLQRQIFYENKSARNQIAIERAKVSAPPGYSEHSTGFAVDFGDGTMRSADFEVEFENTPAFLWLKKNAAKYHFVLSFPKKNIQGVSYEPWHWRYEGTVEALKEFEPANRKRARR